MTPASDSASHALGFAGFTYADLHRPDRLRDLYERFCDDLERRDPAFWAEWDAYRRAPDATRKSTEISSLIVRMAPHVSSFVARLFGIEPATADLRART